MRAQPTNHASPTTHSHAVPPVLLAQPIGNNDTASSRIRCFRFLEFMPPDFKWKLFDGNAADGDVLYVQKSAYQKTLNDVTCAVAKGIKLIYDIDDDFGVYPDMAEKSMIAFAHHITTDTEQRAQYLRTFTPKPVTIIPDALDYVHDNETPTTIRNEVNNIVTFGSNGSIIATIPYLNDISGVTYISQRPLDHLTKHRHVTWQLNNFLNNLKMADIAILAHPQDNRGNMKSNNRLLVAMSIGLPAIVSNTVAYRATMESIGLGDYVVNSPHQVVGVIDKLRDQAVRQAISHKMMKYAWENYHPRTSSLMLARLVDAVRGHSGSCMIP